MVTMRHSDAEELCRALDQAGDLWPVIIATHPVEIPERVDGEPHPMIRFSPGLSLVRGEGGWRIRGAGT